MPVDLNNLQATRYEVVNPGENGIAVVTLNRPESRNAQNKRMTYELEACFSAASRSSQVKVIDRKSTRLNSSHIQKSRMPSSA